MLIVLTGSNSFSLQRELRTFTQAFIAEHGDLALERFDGEDASFDAIKAAVDSPPFLASKKLMILTTPSANKQFLENFETLLSDLDDTTDVVIVEAKLDKRLAYYKWLKKQADFREFPELDSNALASWLVGAAKEQGGSVSQADARYLVERVGSSQQLVASELDKLLLYNSHVTRQTIDLLTEPTPQSTIFQLLEAAFSGNSRRMLDLYAEQRALKVEPQQIIAMLAWQLHILAILKTAGNRSVEDIAKQAKLNPFVVRKSQGIVRKLSLAELRDQIAALLKIDRASKKSALDIDDALQHYLLTLSQ